MKRLYAVALIISSLILVFCISVLSASEPPYPPDWWDSLDVKSLIEKEQVTGSFSQAHTILSPRLLHFIRNWHLIGPFPYPQDTGFQTEFPPEKEMNFKAVYTGKDEHEVSWKQITNKYDQTNLREFGKNSIAYAYTTVHSSEDKDTRAWFSARDEFALWINGEKVYESQDRIDRGYDKYSVEIHLRKGENTILVKNSNYGRRKDFYFYFRISDHQFQRVEAKYYYAMLGWYKNAAQRDRERALYIIARNLGRMGHMKYALTFYNEYTRINRNMRSRRGLVHEMGSRLRFSDSKSFSELQIASMRLAEEFGRDEAAKKEYNDSYLALVRVIAARARDNGEYDTSFNYYRKLLEENRDTDIVTRLSDRFELASLYGRAGRWEKAEKECREIQSQLSDDEKFKRLRDRLKRMFGYIARFKKSNANVNENAGVIRYIKVGERYADEKNIRDAVQQFQSTLERFGDSLYRTGKSEFMGADFYSRQSIRMLGHEGLKAYRGLYDKRAGRLFSRARLASDKKGLFDVVLKYPFSGFADHALHELGDLYLEEGKVSRAALVFNKLLREYPGSEIPRSVVLMKHAFCLLETGDLHGAERSLAEIMEQHGNEHLAVAGEKITGKEYAEKMLTRIRENIPCPDPEKALKLIEQDEIAWELLFPGSEINALVHEKALSNKADPLVYSAVTAQGKAYFHNGRRIFCVSLDKGSIIWQKEPTPLVNEWFTDPKRPDSRYLEPFKVFPVLLYNGKIYVRLAAQGTENGTFPLTFGLYCLDARTGKLIWASCDPDGTGELALKTDPYVKYGIVFTGALTRSKSVLGDYYITALDAETGEFLWKRLISSGIEYLTYERSRIRPAGTGQAMSSANGVLYTATGFGAVAAIDILTGRIIWARENPRENIPNHSYHNGLTDRISIGSIPPLISERSVVFAFPDASGIICVDQYTGELLWEREFLRVQYLIGIHKDRIYLSTCSKVVAVDARDGSTEWEWFLPFKNGWSQSVISKGNIYIPARNGLYVIDMKTGKENKIISFKEDQDPIGNLVFTQEGVLGFSNTGARFYTRTHKQDTVLHDLNPKPVLIRPPVLFVPDKSLTVPLVYSQEMYGRDTEYALCPDGRIYIAQGNRVYAPDLEEPGKVFWETPISMGWHRFKANRDTVVVGYPKRLVGFSASDGKKIWEYQEIWYDDFMLTDNHLIANTRDYYSLIHDLKTGQQVQKFRFRYHERRGGPWIENSRILWASNYDYRIKHYYEGAVLYELDETSLNTGIKKLFEVQGEECQVKKRGSRLFVLKGKGKERDLIGFDMKTGNRLWSVPVTGEYTRWKVTDNHVLITTYARRNPNHYIIDTSTGTVLWEEKRGADKGGLYLDDPDDRDVVYSITHDDYITISAIDLKKKEIRWTTKVSGQYRYAQFAFISGPHIIVLRQAYRRNVHDNGLYILDRATGEIVQECTLPGLPLERADIIGDTLIYKSPDGIYLYRSGDAPAALSMLKKVIESGKASLEQYKRYASLCSLYQSPYYYCEPVERDGAEAYIPHKREAVLNTIDRYVPLESGALWTGPDDLSCRIQSAWDKSGINLTLEVTDNRHENTFSGKSLVLGDSVVVAINNRNNSGTLGNDNYEYVFALARGESRVSHLFGAYPTAAPTVKVSYTPDLAALVYDIRLPWGSFGSDRQHPSRIKEIGLAVSVIDHDGDGPKGQLIWGGGLFGGHEPGQFGTVTFVPLDAQDIEQYQQAICAAADWPETWSLFRRIIDNDTSSESIARGAQYCRWFIENNTQSMRVPDAMGLLWMYEKLLQTQDPEKSVIEFTQRAGISPNTVNKFKSSFISFWMYLDPANACNGLLFQTYLRYYNRWEHRISIGDYRTFSDIKNRINTAAFQDLGSMPGAGQWHQVRFPAGAIDCMHRKITIVSFYRINHKAYLDMLDLAGTLTVNDELPQGYTEKGHWQWVDSPVKSGSKSWATVGKRTRSWTNIEFEKPLIIGTPLSWDITGDTIERIRKFVSIVPDTDEAYNTLTRIMEVVAREKRAEECSVFVMNNSSSFNSAKILKYCKDKGIMKMNEIEDLMKKSRMPPDVRLSFYIKTEPTFRNFALVGPFSDEEILPGDDERFTDLTVNLEEEYAGKEGRRITWERPFTDEPEGYISDRTMKSPLGTWAKDDTLYAYLRLRAPYQRRCTLYSGIQYVTVSAWLNSAKVMDGVHDTRYTKDEHRTEIILYKGWNTLLFKLDLTNHRSWYFSMRLGGVYGKNMEDIEFSNEQ